MDNNPNDRFYNGDYNLSGSQSDYVPAADDDRLSGFQSNFVSRHIPGPS